MYKFRPNHFFIVFVQIKSGAVNRIFGQKYDFKKFERIFSAIFDKNAYFRHKLALERGVRLFTPRLFTPRLFTPSPVFFPPNFYQYAFLPLRLFTPIYNLQVRHTLSLFYKKPSIRNLS